MSSCAAYRVADQMRCKCGLVWDVSDVEPPVCAAAIADRLRARAAALPRPAAPTWSPQPLEPVPVVTSALAGRLQREYERVLVTRSGSRRGSEKEQQVKAIQAVLRMFLAERGKR